MLLHILDWYFGGNSGKNLYEIAEEQLIPNRRNTTVDMSRMDNKYFSDILRNLLHYPRKQKHGLQVEGSLFFECFRNFENLAFHKNKRKLFFPVKDLPVAVRQSIENKIPNATYGRGYDDDDPILIITYVDILQQTPDDTIDLYK